MRGARDVTPLLISAAHREILSKSDLAWMISPAFIFFSFACRLNRTLTAYSFVFSLESIFFAPIDQATTPLMHDADNSQPLRQRVTWLRVKVSSKNK